MSGGLSIAMLWLIGFCILMEVAREVCFKQAADNASFGVAIVKPAAWLGILFWGVELVAWTVVLEHVPLSIAFPLMALSYIAIVLAGAWMLKEPVSIRHGLGALLIAAGVACVGATGI
jgi:undecaprenyl phosphate-alpha-L-ara4N flippase subunit ArnE